MMPFTATWNLGRWGRRVVKEGACACRSNRGPTRDSQPSSLRAAAMCRALLIVMGLVGRRQAYEQSPATATWVQGGRWSSSSSTQRIA
jgi:hypothetical protein